MPDRVRRCRLGACQSGRVQPSACRSERTGASTRPRMRSDLRDAPASTSTTSAPDPLEQFGRWFADAVGRRAARAQRDGARHGQPPDGTPAARTVLLKGVRRARLRASSPTSARARPPTWRRTRAPPWSSRGTRSSGRCGSPGRWSGVGRDEVEAYFATRPRGSQLGAWASPQSAGGRRPRAELDAALAEVEARLPGEVAVPPPALGRLPGGARGRWSSGQGRTGRLHDRLRYRRTGPDRLDASSASPLIERRRDR